MSENSGLKNDTVRVALKYLNDLNYITKLCDYGGTVVGTVIESTLIKPYHGVAGTFINMALGAALGLVFGEVVNFGMLKKFNKYNITSEHQEMIDNAVLNGDIKVKESIEEGAMGNYFETKWIIQERSAGQLSSSDYINRLYVKPNRFLPKKKLRELATISAAL